MDPRDLKFLPTHEWVHLDGDVATVGLSRFAVDQLSDLILIDLPPVGTKVSPGKDFGQIESVKNVSDLYSPVTGEIVEINTALTGDETAKVPPDLQLLAEDPYGKGWLIKVKVADAVAAIPEALDHDAYQRQVAESPH